MSRLREALTRLVAGRAPLPVPIDAKASLTGPLLTLQTLGQPVWAPRDYATFAREGYAQNAIVHRCVRMVAEAAASVPLLLYERDAELSEHPLLDLLRRPSPGLTGTDLLESWYGFLLVAGNAYLEAVGLDGEVRELHALRPDRMKVVPGPDGWPEAWEYEVLGRSVRFAGEVAEGIRPILHMRLFHPANDHYGLSPIEAAAVAIDIHNEAARWNKALLDNSARPSGALVYAGTQGQLTGEQFERLKRELEATYQGVKHAGRPMLLEGGLDWKPLSLSPKDMDFIEAKNAAAREIALALGVPPMLLGIPGDNTYSNYQEATRAFWRQTVLPLVNRTARAISGWLGSGMLEFRADLDQVEALSPEREALWARVEKATFLTRAEKRAAAGYGDDESAGGAGDKFNPYHDELGLFTTEDQAVDPKIGEIPTLNGGEGTDRIRLAQLEGARQYTVDLNEEEANGGHTKRDHVGKSEQYLLGEVTRVRARILFFEFGNKQEGSFDSLETANDLVNRTLEDNKVMVDQVAKGERSKATLNKRFGYVTGNEGFRPDGNSEAYVRPAYGVRVVIRHDKRAERGYRVFTSFPRNEVSEK